MTDDVNVYESPIELGVRYRDQDTQFEGVAVCVSFYRHRTERVCLTALVSHVPSDQWFDAPTLVRVESPPVGFVNGRRKAAVDVGVMKVPLIPKVT